MQNPFELLEQGLTDDEFVVLEDDAQDVGAQATRGEGSDQDVRVEADPPALLS